MRSTYNPRSEDIVKGFRRCAGAGGLKIKHYLLKRAGLASHEIRVGLRSDNPFRIEERTWLDSNYRKCEFYYRSFSSSPFYVMNVSNTIPAVTAFGVVAALPRSCPIRFRDPRLPDTADGLEMSWQHDFIELKKDTEIDLFDVPTLPQGKYLYVPEGQFQSSIWWPEVPQKYGWHDWIGEANVPKETGSRMVSHLESASRGMEVWVYLVLDNDELLPLKWNPSEQIFSAGFWTDGTVLT